jgi:hypothetical protein
MIAYGLVPLAFIPMAAGMIASPRANRFVECVFTAPVNRRDWLAAKILVLVTLAVAYYVALLPMMLVYGATSACRRCCTSSSVDAGVADRQPRHRHADRRAVYRAQPGRAHRGGHGRAACIRGPDAAAGVDGVAGQRRHADRAPHADESGGTAEERARLRAGNQPHSRHHQRAPGSAWRLWW